MIKDEKENRMILVMIPTIDVSEEAIIGENNETSENCRYFTNDEENEFLLNLNMNPKEFFSND